MASPRLVGETRRHLVGRRGAALSSSLGTRHRLVFPPRDETTPHSPAGRLGVASSSSSGTRRRLVFPRGDEATPRSPTGMRQHLLFPQG
ncbi:hypothetical protein GW17_00047427 [Ensete ventricosum]|nr:hypothetical protein GW17_00047427 [Ensete ventricosum]